MDEGSRKNVFMLFPSGAKLKYKQLYSGFELYVDFVRWFMDVKYISVEDPIQ